MKNRSVLLKFFLIFNTLFLLNCSSNSDGYAPGTLSTGSTTVSGIFVSCKDILNSNPSATSGVYSISYDGSGSTASTLSVYCDMTTNGGGWTLVLKQKSNDGTTLQGDSAYFTSAATSPLNDINSNLGLNDENLVSAAFTKVSGTTLMLVAGNEATYQTQPISSSTAFVSFASPTTYSDNTNATRPNWFINTSTYPNSNPITGARFGFNIREASTVSSTTYYCAVRWGWVANQDSAGQSLGSDDSCGGLGAYGTQYGSTYMSSSKSVWQPSYLLLYIK